MYIIRYHNIGRHDRTSYTRPTVTIKYGKQIHSQRMISLQTFFYSLRFCLTHSIDESQLRILCNLRRRHTRSPHLHLVKRLTWLIKYNIHLTLLCLVLKWIHPNSELRILSSRWHSYFLYFHFKASYIIILKQQISFIRRNYWDRTVIVHVVRLLLILLRFISSTKKNKIYE